MAELTLLIADDHQLIRRGLRWLLSMQAGWSLLGEACNGAEAVEMAARLKPDIVILDFFMPKLNGPEAAVQIIRSMPGTGVVILTMDDSAEVVREVVRAGATGLVLKSDADRDLVHAISSVSQKRQFFTGSVTKVILGQHFTDVRNVPTKPLEPVLRLTEREREIMCLLAEGMTSKEVAEKLQVSIRTVESHRINMSRKLGFTSVAGLVRYAIRNGILTEI
jgi:DNA-binding NarL/FixJ family response regulator